MRSVCVYCASSSGYDPALAEAAQHLGARIAEAGLALVYGGGSAGLMGALATAALDAGGSVTGVLPTGLFPDEVIASPLRDHHDGTFYLLETGSMHERKAQMEHLSDGFVALPGGFGTLEELAEILTWAQIGLHAKPIVLLNLNGYYDHFVAFLDRMVHDGLLRVSNRDLLRVVATAEEVVPALGPTVEVTDPKWR